jgi:hypothetical protein
MARYVQTVQSAPVVGADEEFNRWYHTTHLPEVLGVPGFVSGQRFQLVGPAADGQPRYLAVYEIETDDLDVTLRALAGAATTMTQSEAMDAEATVISLYEVLGERRVAADVARANGATDGE